MSSSSQQVKDKPKLERKNAGTKREFNLILGEQKFDQIECLKDIAARLEVLITQVKDIRREQGLFRDLLEDMLEQEECSDDSIHRESCQQDDEEWDSSQN